MAKRITLSDGNKVNSKGYRIDLSGMNTDRFADNPVMLYQHNQDKVIGRWENWSFTENKLQADPKFDDGDELGSEVKRKYEGDFLRAASIGIIVLEVKEVDGILTVTKSELLEASIVSIPADAGAVVLYNEKREVLNFEQLQLELNNNQTNQKGKMELKLSEKTIESLGLTPGDITAKEVELAVAEKDKKIAQLNADLKTQKDAQITDFLANAVKVGKIQESEKAHFEKLAASDFESVKAIIGAKAESATETLADKVKGKSNLSAGREDWTYMDWMKKDSKGLLQLKHENPKEFERIQETIKK